MAWLDLIVEFSPTTVDALPNWVDITDYVETVSIQRGRSDELSQFQTGSMVVRLRNDDRRFDPLYVSGPYYPNLLPKCRFRVRSEHLGEDFGLFYGFCHGFPQDDSYVENRSWVDVRCSDAFEWFSSYPIIESFWTHATTEDEDLWAWFRFKDQSNVYDGVTYANDSGPNAFQGVYTPRSVDFSWGESMVPSGSSFSPDRKSYVEVIGNGYIQGSSRWLTIEFMFKMPEIPDTSGSGSIFGSDLSLGAYVADFDDLGLGPGSLMMQFGVKRSTSGVYVGLLHPSKNVCDNRWHHCVFTLDATSQEANLYIDGVHEAYLFFNEGGGITYSLQQTPTEPLRFGRGATGGGAIPIGQGSQVGEILFYNVEKDQTWVTQRYNDIQGYAGERTGVRIQRLLNLIGQSPFERNLDLGDSLVSAHASGTVLEAMNQAAEAEMGMLYIDGEGTVQFKNRTFYLSDDRAAAVQAFFADSGSDLRYVDVEWSDDDQYVFNVGEASRESGPTFTFIEETSATKYFRRVSSKTGLKLYNDNEARAYAEWLAKRQSEPETRVTALVIDARTGSIPAYFMGFIEIADRLSVSRQPQSLGSAWIVTGIVDSIRHEIDLSDRRWNVTYKLAPIDDETILILGTDTDRLDSPLGF